MCNPLVHVKLIPPSKRIIVEQICLQREDKILRFSLEFLMFHDFFNREGFFSNFSFIWTGRAISAIFFQFEYDLGIFRIKENKMHSTYLHNHLFHKSLSQRTSETCRHILLQTKKIILHTESNIMQVSISITRCP